MVSQTPIGTVVKVKLHRPKNEIELDVVVTELPKKMAEESAEDEELGKATNQEESTALAGLCS